MVFSTNLFLLYFFPVFFVLYFVVPTKAKNYIALLGSVLFYTWGAPKFIFVLLGAIAIDFFLAQQMHQAGSKKKRRNYILLAVIINVALLGFFKYANFFVENVNALLNAMGVEEVGWTKIALPIGISFFTFQKISYLVDVYRGDQKPLNNIFHYALYVILFPQLIAGPIVRFNEIADQIKDRTANDTVDEKLLGVFRFVLGLSKKVLIANVLGAEADRIFDVNTEMLETGEPLLSSGLAWIGALAYTFQIYFDFSGYSDMAIGVGQMMGFRFPENFNFPYIAQNITEFWRRWHMTLSRWMRDYLYIPLGGNRVTKGRLYFNLSLVFIISGFWHGASWNFIIWGGYHGLFLILDRLFLINLTKHIGKLSRMLLTFFIVVIGWIFFRAETLPEAGNFLHAMFSFTSEGETISLSTKLIFIGFLAILFSFMGIVSSIELLPKKAVFLVNNLGVTILVSLGCIALMMVNVAEITSAGFNPFIYFRF